MRRYLLLTAVLAAAALAGCGSSPKASFYTLTSDAMPRQAPATVPQSVAIGVVTVPDAVDRPQLVTRSGANQVTINEFARWAEPLRGEIPRVIADNLSRELNGDLVSTYPQSASMNADCAVLLQVQRFDSALGEAATIEVLWTVRPLKGEPRSGRSTVREATSGATFEDLVAAHSRALAAVSRDIAGAVRAARGKQ